MNLFPFPFPFPLQKTTTSLPAAALFGGCCTLGLFTVIEQATPLWSALAFLTLFILFTTLLQTTGATSQVTKLRAVKASNHCFLFALTIFFPSSASLFLSLVFLVLFHLSTSQTHISAAHADFTRNQLFHILGIKTISTRQRNHCKGMLLLIFLAIILLFVKQNFTLVAPTLGIWLNATVFFATCTFSTHIVLQNFEKEELNL